MCFHIWHVSARSRRLYLASSFRSSWRGLSAHCVSRPRYTRHFSGLLFRPSGAPAQYSCQASGARNSQLRLSSFLLTKDGSRGCNAVGCANTNEHRPTNTRNSFSAPEAVLSEVEQRFDCVQAQTHIRNKKAEKFSHPCFSSILLYQ